MQIAEGNFDLILSDVAMPNFDGYQLLEFIKDNNIKIKGNELIVEDETGDLYYHKGHLSTPIKTEGGEGLR